MAASKRKSKSGRTSKRSMSKIDVEEQVAAAPSSDSSGRRLRSPFIFAGVFVAIVVILIGMKLFYLPQQPQAIVSGPEVSQPEKTAPVDVQPITDLEPLDHSFTFEEVFARLNKADKAQNTDFRKESLIKNPIQMKKIDPLLIEARDLRDDLNRSVINNETFYWLNLVEGRIDMLESQKYLHLALAYGREGLMSKNITDSCARRKIILDASLLYNMSARKGGQAMNHFDEVLVQEETWPVLGINDKKMAFYGGDTRDIGGMAYNNVEAVRVKCMGLEPGDSPSMWHDQR